MSNLLCCGACVVGMVYLELSSVLIAPILQGKPLTFDEFQRWAQHTPAVQALLQGAFPSDAHFSLATSPR